MAQVATAEILLKLNTREYDQQLTQVQRQFSGLSREAFNLQVNTRDADLALQTTLGIITQITSKLKGFGQSAIGEAQAFQGALNSLQAISGGTEEQLSKLRDTAIQVGAATTQTPVQVLRAAESFSRLGFSIEQATAAAPGLVSLAESTGSNLESAAGVAAKALNIYGDSIDSLQVANVLTATINKTAVESIDEFNQAISKAGGVAKNNGIKFEELAAAFGLLRGSGSSPEVAATALRNIITRLAVPGTDKAKEAIKGLGLETRDAAGNLRGLEPLLADLISKLGALGDSQLRDETIRNIFGDEALAAVSGLVAKGLDPVAEKFGEIAAVINDADFALDSANTRLQGAAGAFNALEGSVETASLVIGESLLPAAELAARAGTALINVFTSLPVPLQKTATLAGATAVGLGAIVTSLSALRAAQQADTFSKIGLSAGALKETLSIVGAQVQGVVGKFGALGSIKVGLPQRTQALSVDEAFGVQSAAIAERAAAAQTASLTERAAKEAEFVAFKKQLAAQEAALEARRIARDETASVAAQKRAAAEAGRLKASANIARIDAESARVTAAGAAADLQAATAAEIAATAEVKKATVTKASTASEVISTTVTKGKIALTKSLAFVTDVLTVALGRKKAADVSATAAAVAGAAQLAIYAGAVLVAAENLKVLGVIGNDSAKKLREFRKELDKESKAPIEKSDLGLLDRLRVGFDQLNNVRRKYKVTEEESIAAVTSVAQKERQELEASEALKNDLIAIVVRDSVAIKARNKAILEGIQADSLSTEQRAEQATQLEEQLKQKQKEIELAKSSGLEATKEIALLENQAIAIQESIDLLQGKEVITKQQAIANQIQAKSIEELTEAQKAANNEADIAIAKTKALATERLASGEITESEVQSDIAQAEKEGLQKRLDANKVFLDDLKKQQSEAEGAVSAEGAKEIQEAITNAEKEQFDLRLQLAQNAINEQKRLSDERLKVIQESESERLSEIEKSDLAAQKILLEQQLSGVRSAEDTQAAIALVEQNGLEERLEEKRNSLKKLQAEDQVNKEDQVQQIEQAEKEIAQLEIDLVTQRLRAKEQAQQKELALIKESQSEASAAINEAFKNEELALKQSLAKQLIDREEFDRRIEESQKQSALSRIAEFEKEAQRIKESIEKGTVPREEAEQRLAAIRQSITDENIKLVDQEIATQQKAADEVKKRFDVEIESRKASSDLARQALEFEKAAIAQQAELATAQQGLLDAQSALSLQRLKFAREDALTQEQRFALDKQIFAAEKAATLAKLENERKVLDLKIQQQKLDSQIAASQAEISILEAKAAIEAAKARGASQEELANLQKVLELKQNILDQTAGNAVAQEELFKIQKDTLAVNQELTKEQLARQEQLLGRQNIGLNAQTAEERREEREAARIIGRLDQREFSSSGAKAKAVADVALKNFDNEALLSQLSSFGGFIGQIASIAGQLNEIGVSQSQGARLASRLTGAKDSGDVVDLLKQLVDAVKASDRPNISVSTATPVSDVLSILRG